MEQTGRARWSRMPARQCAQREDFLISNAHANRTAALLIALIPDDAQAESRVVINTGRDVLYAQTHPAQRPGLRGFIQRDFFFFWPCGFLPRDNIRFHSSSSCLCLLT